MGFDDVLPAAVATPPISTIRQPLKEMGKEAAERVLRAIKQKQAEDKSLLHMPPPELVARQSTGPAPPAQQPNAKPRRSTK